MDDAAYSAPNGAALQQTFQTLELLGNVVSLAVWTPFNEGWGQFDANAVAQEVRRLDPTRQVNHTSGWVDQGGGDVRSFHSYLRPFAMPARQRGRHLETPEALTAALEELHLPLLQAARDGLAATVYTQLSDVEDELNGLLTWDREVLKVDPDVVRHLTARLRDAMTAR